MKSGYEFMILGYKARLLHPEVSLLVLVVLVGVVLRLVLAFRDAARLRRQIPARLFDRLVPGFAPVRRGLRLGASGLGALMLSLALVQPQCGTGTELARKMGIDVVVALDVSRSMLARDVTPSRLARARLELADLIDHLKGDRFGLVVFAGTAFVQCPMTTDYAAAKLFLRAVRSDQMPTQGTNIAAALKMAGDLLRSREGARSKIVVLITDGEDHSGHALEAAKALAEDDVRIFTVGIGSPAGEPIPVFSKQGDVIGYKKDRAGNTVLSKLDEKTLQAIAKVGDGAYIAAGTGGAGIEEVIERMDEMEKSEFEARLTTRWEDRSAFFLFPAFFFLVLAALMPPGRRPRRGERARSRARVSGAAMGRSAAVLLLVASPWLTGFSLLETKEPSVERGNEAFHKGDYDVAVQAYDDALGRLKEPADRARVYYDKGTALAAKGDVRAARQALLAALEHADEGLQATDLYNLGTALLKAGDPKKASEALIRSLKIDPENAAARHNLELALRALQKKDSKQGSPKASPQDKKQEQKDESSTQQSQEQQQGAHQGQEKKPSDPNQKGSSKRDGQQGQQDQDAQSQGQPEDQKGNPEAGGSERHDASSQGEQARRPQGSKDEEAQRASEASKDSEETRTEPDRASGEEAQSQPKDAQKQAKRAAGAAGEGTKKDGKEGQARLTSAEAKQILDALARGERPLQMQLFQLRDYDEDAAAAAGGKDW